MKKLGCIIVFLLVLFGCSKGITANDLQGTWLVTNGYEDGQIDSDPVCPLFDEGLEFIDQENVYVIAEKKEFIYRLSESDEGMELELYHPNGEIDFYKITIENEDAFGLNGSGVIKTLNCYFEREK